jgi:hypothetical protein
MSWSLDTIATPHSCFRPKEYRLFLCPGYKPLAYGRGPGSMVGISAPSAGQPGPMFFFFSNRLGCLGSIVVSLVITGILLLLLGVL